MAGSYPSGQSTGAYINTTTIQDIQLLKKIDLNGDDFRQLLMRLYESVGMLEKSINQRSAGLFPQEEFVTGDVYYPQKKAIVGTTNGSGNASGSVSGFFSAPYGLNQTFNIGTSSFIVSALGSPASLTRISGIGSGTFNTTTGTYSFTGTSATENIIFTVQNSLTNQKPVERQVFRKVIPMCPYPNATLPNNGAIGAPHGITITDNLFFTKIYAVAKSPTTGPNWIPIPFVEPNDPPKSIYIDINGGSVFIRTGSDRTSYNQVIAVLEYLKS